MEALTIIFQFESYIRTEVMDLTTKTLKRKHMTLINQRTKSLLLNSSYLSQKDLIFGQNHQFRTFRLTFFDLRDMLRDK